MSSWQAESMPAGDESRLVAALRRGDETAFVALLDRYHLPMVRLAQAYVGDRATAEEVVQETWLGLVRGIDRFEGRAALKTWLFRILVHQAKRRAEREGRSVPFSALSGDAEVGTPAVEPERFLPAGDEWADHWADSVQNWGDGPEARLLAQETRAVVERAIADLPPGQRAVITLRDVEGWSGPEVCAVLGLTDANQRVLLHRARSRVRRALESYLTGV